MKTILLAIGRTDEEYLRHGVQKYTDRLTHYTPFELIFLPDAKNVKNMTQQQQKVAEGKAILGVVEPSDVVILLDENGQELTSRQFAKFIEKHSISGARRLIFIIGGPYGFSDEVYERANGKLSLSRMTYSHQMVRLIFAEQLYRAHTILKGEPYHHD